MTETVTTSTIKSATTFRRKVLANPVPCFLLFWTVFNLIQAGFTELTSDEGYYWFYAQHLQWGYYDHPPMIALMIKAGNYLFGGELGVRFFNVLLSTGTLHLFFTLLPGEVKKSAAKFLVVLSAPLVHYLTFIVFPDGPLLFFTVAFLVAYKRFLSKTNFTSALLLGICIAFMAWSKYHGALVVLFTVIANPKLLKQVPFYFSLLVALLLFAPHLWWQYTNNFPTLRYHLSGRTGSYSFRHVGEYLSQQIFAIGPGLVFIPFVSKSKNVFERTLFIIIIGTFTFFLLSSFKTFVHFHWTSIALFPLLYFAVQYYQKPQSKRLYRFLILPFVVLFFIARFLLMVPVMPTMHVGEDYYHSRKAWAEDIAAIAANRPAFFPNNLREASLYSFYSGSMGVTLYTQPEKKSQYELWGYEDSLQGKEVVVLTKYPLPGGLLLQNRMNQKLYYSVLPNFHSYYSGIEITPTLMAEKHDSVCTISLHITNERKSEVKFDSITSNGLASLFYLIEQNKKVIRAEIVPPLPDDNLLPGSRKKKTISVPLQNLPAGKYEILFGIRNNGLPDAILSEAVPLSVP